MEFSPLTSFKGDLDLRAKARWVGAVQRVIAGISFQKSGSVDYTFQISKAGKYTAKKWNGVDLFLESLFAYKESDAINKTGTNNLRVITQGDLFKLYINGVFIDEMQDNLFAQGRVGIYAFHGKVTFDNFEVRWS